MGVVMIYLGIAALIISLITREIKIYRGEI